MRIPKEIVETIWKKYPTRIEWKSFPDGEDEAVEIFSTAYLRVNGEIYEFDLPSTDDLILAEDIVAIMYIAVAIRWHVFPELWAALPSRPESAATCSRCKGSGRMDFFNHPQSMLCDDCNGLGWIAS